MKRRINVLLVIFFCLAVPVCLLAQPPELPEGGEVLDTPIDGGLSLLLAAGAAYGVKKYRNQQRKKEEK